MRFTEKALARAVKTMRERIAIVETNSRYSARYALEAKRERESLNAIEALGPEDDVTDRVLLEAIGFHLYGEDAALDPVAYLTRHHV